MSSSEKGSNSDKVNYKFYLEEQQEGPNSFIKSMGRMHSDILGISINIGN